jgi:hypothetical protein
MRGVIQSIANIAYTNPQHTPCRSGPGDGKTKVDAPGVGSTKRVVTRNVLSREVEVTI